MKQKLSRAQWDWLVLANSRFGARPTLFQAKKLLDLGLIVEYGWRFRNRIGVHTTPAGRALCALAPQVSRVTP